MDFSWWGWNARTVSFVGTFVSTAVQAWGLGSQIRLIWHQRSGLSVNTPMFIFHGSLFFTFFLYGITRSDIAIIVNGGVLGALYIPILVGLARYKGIPRWQRCFGYGILVVIAIVSITGVIGWAYVTGSFVAASFYLLQVNEIVRNRSRGVVSGKLLGTFLVSTLFWMVYGYASNDTMLKIVTPLFCSVLLITIAVWLRYPSPLRLITVRSEQQKSVLQP